MFFCWADVCFYFLLDIQRNWIDFFLDVNCMIFAQHCLLFSLLRKLRGRLEYVMFDHPKIYKPT